jgi:signal peptidase I
MSGDLSGLLIALLVASALILLVDTFVLRPKRTPGKDGLTVPEPAIVRHSRSLLPVLLIVLVFRSFLFEPFRIPSASMMPGLVDGDFILVNKFTYGLRLPLINTKVLSVGAPQRGDVVVFRAPWDHSVNLIKRLVGLPGDHVVVRDNHVAINGAPIPLSPDGSYQGGYGFSGAALGKERFGASEHVIMLAPRLPADFDGVVPAGHYFFMGDNRNDSEDSRFAKVGFVSEDFLVGRAIRIWMNWQIPGWPHLGRVGLPIR